MAEPFRVELRGVEPIRNRLALLGQSEARKILRSAIRSAGAVMLRGARQRAPARTGALRRAIRLSTRAFSGGSVQAKVAARGVVRLGRAAAAREVDVWFAHIIEGGAGAHVIKPKLRKALAFGGRVLSRIRHPGFAGRHFLEHTAAQDLPAATQAFTRQAEIRLARYLDTGAS